MISAAFSAFDGRPDTYTRLDGSWRSGIYSSSGRTFCRLLSSFICFIPLSYADTLGAFLSNSSIFFRFAKTSKQAAVNRSRYPGVNSTRTLISSGLISIKCPPRVIILLRGGEILNQVAFNILKKAYSQYQNSGSLRHSIILSGNTDDILNSIQALQKEGYIERIVQTELEFAFDLSTIGIEYMASNQEAF